MLNSFSGSANNNKIAF